MTTALGPRVCATSVTTVGEWLQVHDPRLGRVHVTCPVGWRTTAVLSAPAPTLCEGQPTRGKVRPATMGTPGERVPLGRKSETLLHTLGEQLGIPTQTLALTITSPVPEGKGLASSTADLVAMASALYAFAGLPVDGRTIHQAVIDVEASDAIMFPGLVMAKLDEATVLASVDTTPPVVFATLIPDSILVTENQPASTPYEDAPAMLRTMNTAMVNQDLALMARLATESATLAQDRINTPNWGLVNAIGADFDGLGVIIGHSGTVSAVICDTTHPHHPSRLEALCRTLEEETGMVVAVAQPDLAGPRIEGGEPALTSEA